LKELCKKGSRMTIVRLMQNGKYLNGCIVLFNYGIGVGGGLPFQAIYKGTLNPVL
jgi:hypothetical protein